MDWNSTVSLIYPPLSGLVSRFVNDTKRPDWTPAGLYNGTSSTDYDNFVAYPTVVTCRLMTNGTWTLTFDGHNYVVAIDAPDSSVITGTATINAWFKDLSSVSVTTGSSNITIWRDTSVVAAPPNQTTTSGVRIYGWDIDLNVTQNGRYRIEVFWTNGTEAGYRTETLVVYFPTELTTPLMTINAYTSSSFSLRVFFGDTFTPQPLTGTDASVTYSFGSGPTLLTDLGNGTWSATVTTAGKVAGSYVLYVNASGWALENRTLQIDVILIYDTSPLQIQWSQTSTITYIEFTTLSVRYQFLNGTPVTGATLDMTDGITIWSFTYSSSSGTYNHTFYGSDALPGLGVHNLIIKAWKTGYQNQTDSLQTLTITKEPTSLTPDWTSYSFDWTHDAVFAVDYRDSYGAFITDATQKDILINGTYYVLNGNNGTYWIELNNTFELWHHVIVVNMSRYGYEFEVLTGATFDITEAVTLLSVVWAPANVTIIYTNSLNIAVEYTYGGGDVPVSAILNVTIGGKRYGLTYSTGAWHASIPGADIGIGVHDATVLASLHGYEARSNLTTGITVILAPNSFWVTWNPSDLNATFVEQIQVTVVYTYDFEPVSGATVKLILNGTRVYDLTLEVDDLWHITLATSAIDLGVWNATILANKTGYDTGREVVFINIQTDPCTLSPSSSDITIYYTHNADLDVTFLDSFGQPLVSGLVIATYQGVNYTLPHVGGGVYRLQLNGSVGVGQYPIEVISERYGFLNRTSNVNFTVIETPTTISVTVAIRGNSSSVLYNDGWVEVTVRLEDDDSAPVTLALVNLTIAGKVFTLQLQPSSNYTLTLYASVMGLGFHGGTIRADANGYEAKLSPLSFTVERVPAHVELSLGSFPSVMFLNQTVVVRLDYVDNHTGLRITGAGTRYFIWPNDLLEQEVVPGVFEVSISSLSLPLAIHAFNVTIGHVNFTTGSYVRSILVSPVNTLFTTRVSMRQFENELVVIWVNYTDVDHGQFIHWASVNATIDGTAYPMTYSSRGNYSMSYRISLPPRTQAYVISIAGSATGCFSNSTTTMLYVDAKDYVYLDIRLDANPMQGNSVGIKATLKENDTDTPVSGAYIIFRVTVEYENGTRYLSQDSYPTNAAGEANWAFQIPLGVDYLDVEAYYAGAVNRWSASTTKRFEVTPTLFSQLMLFLTSTPGLMMLGSIMVAAVATTAYNKMHKPKARAAKLSMEQQLQAFNDLGSLKHFIAVYVGRGTCVFYHPFAEARIQADLISGFIAAITSVYGELKGDGVQGTLEEIHYHGLKLNSYSGKYVIGILILEGELTQLLKERLQYFIEVFESKYEDHLKGWKGETDCFDPEWIVSNLNAAFNYRWVLPHKISTMKRMDGTSRKIINLLSTKLNERGEFFIGDVIDQVAGQFGKTDAQALDRLLMMEERGFLVPINIQTILQRQGMTLPGNETETEEPDSEPIMDQETAPSEEIKEPVSEHVPESEEMASEEKAEEPTPEALQWEESVISGRKPPEVEAFIAEEYEPTTTEDESVIEGHTPVTVEEEVHESPHPEGELSWSAESIRPTEKTSPVEQPKQPEVEAAVSVEKPEPKPEEQFVADIERLLSSEPEPKAKRARGRKKPAADEAERFIEDVEHLLSKDEKKEDED